MIEHPQEILVLVHPGSACGSANYNLGRSEARAARDALIFEIERWHGGLLVIDGELSDELTEYPLFDSAIQQALRTAEESSKVSQRVTGDDPDQVQRITEFVSTLSEQEKARTTFTVTGAWFDPSDGEGCVGSVHKQLLALGCKSQVGEGAVNMPSEDDCEPAEHASPVNG